MSHSISMSLFCLSNVKYCLGILKFWLFFQVCHCHFSTIESEISTLQPIWPLQISSSKLFPWIKKFAPYSNGSNRNDRTFKIRLFVDRLWYSKMFLSIFWNFVWKENVSSYGFPKMPKILSMANSPYSFHLTLTSCFV